MKTSVQNNKAKKTASVLIFLFFFCGRIFTQSPPQSIADSLQAILDRSLPTNFSAPGAVMGVVAPGQWAWFGASGNAIAGITSGQPVTNATATTKFRVGSITKNMVAACILKLEQQGLLNINDPINNYLRSTLITDTIAASDTVTIRHLLNHTSGIANSADNVSCQTNVLTNPLGSHTLEEAVYCGASQGEIFAPGFAWAYSNTNYSLLAMIIEKVSGQSYASFLTQQIIVPLNLSNTEIPVTNQISTAHMGCYWNLGTWVDLTIINPTTYTGWADVVSTTQDLTTYYQALLSGNVINSTELAIMKTIDAASYDYGMGMDFYHISGYDYFGHYGEVANTSGMFFGNIQSSKAPNGYYIVYNFNTQGVNMQSLIDVPVMQELLSNPASVNEVSFQQTLKIYPNPAHDKITIEKANGNVEICDLTGRSVMEVQNNNQSTLTLDVSSLSAGTYLVRVSATKMQRIQKLVIE